MFNWVGTDLLSRSINSSTISADGLNDSVRNGKRWDPIAIGTNVSLVRLANLFSFVSQLFRILTITGKE